VLRLDRTILELMGIPFALAGVFGSLQEYAPPEMANATWGQNSFVLKAEIVNSTNDNAFAVLTVLGVGVTIVAFFLRRIPRRVNTRRQYAVMLAVSVAVALASAWLVAAGARAYARTKWEPIVVENQREAFEVIEFVVERGVQPAHADLPQTSPDYEMARRVGAQVAARYLETIEALLEVPVPAWRTLQERTARVESFFSPSGAH
jgi:4-amino-4-deoxy-L-arabinose transferase-like glycosyltransferase